MNLDRTQQFTDVIHENILYTGLEGGVISTPIFNRLHNVLQSSLVYLTYPSNKVKRFEHSIGTMYLSGEMFYNAFVNSLHSEAEKQLMNESKKALQEWFEALDVEHEVTLSADMLDRYSKDTILTAAPLPKCSLYMHYLPYGIDDELKFVYTVLFQSIRLAGLLHDVGHLPYSHVFEYATKLLYAMVSECGEQNEAQKQFLNIMKEYCEGKNELHEEIGLSLLKQIKIEIGSILKEKITDENLFVSAVFFFTNKILSSSDYDNDFFSDIHRIVAGVVDADRLDYCSRDSLCSGMTKYIFPYKRFISTFRIIQNRKMDYETNSAGRDRLLFSPALKCIGEVEELLDRRWKIFSTINYHHRVHKHEIIFSEVLAYIGYEELKNMEGNIPDIKSGNPLELKLSSIWALIKLLKVNKKPIDYLVIQLDDSWMDSLLKKTFFEKYGKNYRNISKFGSDYIWNMFDELISAQKHYYSRFKRSVDFVSFDEKIRAAWLDKNDDGTQSDNALKNRLTAILQDKALLKSKNKFSLTLMLTELNKKELDFYQEVEKKVNELLDKDRNIGIKYCMLRPCSFSLGYKVENPILLWNYDNSVTNFFAVSKKHDHLQELKSKYLPFHLYYLPGNYKNEPTREDVAKLEDILVEIMVELLDHDSKSN